MNKILLPLLALAFAAAECRAQSAPGQKPAPPSPAPTTPAPPAAGSPAGAAPAATPPGQPGASPTRRPPAGDPQLLETGGFELPRVQSRSPASQGGDFLKFAKFEWSRFTAEDGDETGKVVAGLTNEIARSGRQSLFLQFTKVTKPQALIDLATEALPIKPRSTYRISIWGRLDKKQPLTIEQRIPSLRLKLDFLRRDQRTPTGQQVLKTQPMPGSLNRPPIFTADRWSEYFVVLKSPEDAAFVKFTWSWITPSTKGETSGTIFFDDATLIGPRADPPAPPVMPSSEMGVLNLPVVPAPPLPPGPRFPGAPEPQGQPGVAPAQDPSPTPITPAGEAAPSVPEPRVSATPASKPGKKP